MAPGHKGRSILFKRGNLVIGRDSWKLYFALPDPTAQRMQTLLNYIGKISVILLLGGGILLLLQIYLQLQLWMFDASIFFLEVGTLFLSSTVIAKFENLSHQKISTSMGFFQADVTDSELEIVYDSQHGAAEGKSNSHLV